MTWARDDAWSPDPPFDTSVADCCNRYCQNCEHGKARLEAAIRLARLRPSRTIPLTCKELQVYEDIDDHRYGVVFDEVFPIDQDFMGDIWGFGKTKAEAVGRLITQTEEYNALYYNKNLRFTFTR